VRFTFRSDLSHRRKNQPVPVSEEHKLLPPPGKPRLRLDEGYLPHSAGEQSGFPLELITNWIHVQKVVIRPQLLLLSEDFHGGTIDRDVPTGQQNSVGVLRIDESLQTTHEPGPKRGVGQRRPS